MDQAAGVLPMKASETRRGSLARRAGRLVTGGVALWLALVTFGLMLTHSAVGATVTRWDGGVSRWAAAHRTPVLNGWTDVGSEIANTPAAIAVVAIAVLVLGPLLKRWQDAAILIVAVLGELVIFLLVTMTVDRPRPPVPHLDAAPPTSSFPSGHTAAAVALYVGLAVIALRSHAPRPAVWPVVTLLCLIPVIVGVSRVYRGMHYPTDVLAGAILGSVWLVVTLALVGSARRRGADRPASMTVARR